MANPTPAGSDVCSLCGGGDIGEEGRPRLEWDHLGGAGNNELLGWWLCDQCHSYVTFIQRRDGDSWNRDRDRDPQVRDAWTLHGATTRLGIFNDTLPDGQADIDPVALRRSVHRHLISGTGLFDEEGSYRRPGPNPIANDIASAVAARVRRGVDGPPKPRPRPGKDLPRVASLFMAIFELDRLMPGPPLVRVAKKRRAKTVRRLYRLALEGRLTFLTAAQSEVRTFTQRLAVWSPEEDPPEGIGFLLGFLQLVRGIVEATAEAESLEKARLAVDALVEQWSTTPASLNLPSSN